MLYIGTSGWNYSDWRGTFYPEDLPARQYLAWYSSRFSTTELNYSFYHLPRGSTFKNWFAQTPEGFVFAVKAHRSITHVRRLEAVEGIWSEFLENASELKHKLGPVLLQFPPSLRARPEVLRAFLESSRRMLGAKRIPLAFEFRHSSWFSEEVEGLLREHGAAMVIADSERFPQAPLRPTAPFVYLRFHGPGRMFASEYSEAELREWAGRITAWRSQGLAVFAYFNNDFHGYALNNARTLGELLAGARVPAANALPVRPAPSSRRARARRR